MRNVILSASYTTCSVPTLPVLFWIAPDPDFPPPFNGASGIRMGLPFGFLAYEATLSPVYEAFCTCKAPSLTTSRACLVPSPREIVFTQVCSFFHCVYYKQLL